MVPLSLGHEPLFDTVLYGLLSLGFAVMGALILTRQPGHWIGWIFCAFGVWGAVTETWESFAYHSLPTGRAGEWLISWSWVPDIALFGLIFLLFPSGRLLSHRWRAAVWLLVVGCALAAPGQALSPDNPSNFEDGVNPLAVNHPLIPIAFVVGVLLLLAGLVIAVSSMLLRYRRAAGIERLQIRQFVFAGTIIVTFAAAAVPFYYDSVLVQAAVAVAFLALPIATGISILRYGLYDIDRIISRTLTYGLLTAGLALTYAGLVIGLQALLRPLSGGSDLAIVLTTLVVAALFLPARRRIQDAVDRRFNRRAYNAARTIDAFSARLREQIDLDTLRYELLAVVDETMQPAKTSLWLRPAQENGR
jgi:hypothetical protein